MPRTRTPHRGSLQVWPRVRAKRAYPRIRTWKGAKEARPLGFPGYKAGMTHIMLADNRQHSMTKGKEIFMPVTILECPPLKVASVRFYKKSTYGLSVSSEIFAEKPEKELGRKISLPKKASKKIDDFKAEDCHDIRILAYTQPKLTGIGKKKPEVFELGIGGSVQEKLNYAKAMLGKDIRINDFAKEGKVVDIHGVTRGHGTQGPRRRFGVMLRQHKSEKAIRNPGNVGPWTGPASWRVAHAGKMGYHQRTEYNKWIVKIGDNPADVMPRGGLTHYSNIKNQYVLVKGSLPGSTKRMIMMTDARRDHKKFPRDAPAISIISTDPKK